MVPWVVGASWWLAACGSSNSTAAPPYGGSYADASVDPRFDVLSPARDAGKTPLPPEREETRSFQTPQAGGRYVYVANPLRDSVAVIDSRTLALQTVEAGDGPTYLATVPGQDQALVINVNAQTVTILRTDERGTHTTHVPVVPGANTLAVAPDGRHAVAYLDTASQSAASPGSFQDITVITLDPAGDRAVQLSVGFRPIEVEFSRDGASAFVVTEDGVSILRFAELTEPMIVPSVSLDDGAPAPGVDGGVAAQNAPRDVSVTPDGRYAVARTEGSPVLRLIDLQSRAVTTLTVSSPVTDLDLSPDGTFALAVLRNESLTLRVPIPGGFADSASVRRIATPGETVGSVTIAPDGSTALLYTTAAITERATLLDLAGTTAPQLLRLRKVVRSIAYAPDGRTAVLVHGRAPGDPNDPTIDLETRIDRAYGYSLFDARTRFIKLQLTAADVGPLALSTDGAYAFVLLRDDARAVARVERVSMRSFAVQDITLGSPPLSVGAVPATQRVFVGQQHPEGRITFIDWNTGALQSLTGFELNSRIVE